MIISPTIIESALTLYMKPFLPQFLSSSSFLKINWSPLFPEFTAKGSCERRRLHSSLFSPFISIKLWYASHYGHTIIKYKISPSAKNLVRQLPGESVGPQRAALNSRTGRLFTTSHSEMESNRGRHPAERATCTAVVPRNLHFTTHFTAASWQTFSPNRHRAHVFNYVRFAFWFLMCMFL